MVVIGIGIALPYVVMGQLLDQRVEYTRVYGAGEFGLERADSMLLKTTDGVDISVIEVPADTVPKAVVLCLSGIHNPSVTAYFGHAKMFGQKGIASLLIDMRAHGLSGGDRICAAYKEYRDVDAAVAYVRSKEIYQDVPIVVMGVSMGGAVAINAIGNNPEIDALVSLSAFSSWEEAFKDNVGAMVPSVVASALSPFVDLVSYLKFGDEWAIKPIRSIEKLGERPALFIHSKGDSQVLYTNMERLLEKAPKGVETYTVEGDKHLILDNFLVPQNDSIYSQVLMQFMDKVVK